MRKVGYACRRTMSLVLAGPAMTLLIGTALAQQISIDFWDMKWGGGSEYAAVAEKLVARYNSENSAVQVVYRSVPWNNWYETFVTAVASGSAPDLSTGAGFQAVQLYDQGAILPVDKLVAEIDQSDFAPGTFDAMKYDGHYVGIPWGLDPRVLWYRKDLLEAAGVKVPTNWQELRDVAKAVTGNGKYGLVSSGDPTGMHWILTSTINNGGGLFDTEGKPSLTGERSMEALQFLAGLVADGSVNPASVGYVADDARGEFVRGKAAFILDGLGLPSLMPPGQEGNIGLVPPISGPHGDKGTFTSVNNIMVYNQTTHPAETMAFLKWWSENALPLWTEGHASQIPARISLANDKFFQSNPNIASIIKSYQPIGKPLSAQAPGTFPELNEIDGDGFLLSLVQSIWQGQPISANVEAAQAHLQEVMADRR